jgi:2-dehydro-3-deoxygluconokinase
MNVKSDFVCYGGDRLGVFFLETGASMRPSLVLYDRARSAIAEASDSDFEFDEFFSDADWFPFTGITPAMSDSAAQLTELALKAAKKQGVIVSCDLNYRKKLWSSEKAQKVMSGFMQYVDVCIGNEEDAEKVLGFRPGKTDVTKGDLELAGYRDICEQMVDKYNFKYVISSLRESYSQRTWLGPPVFTAATPANSTLAQIRHSYRRRVAVATRFAGGFISQIFERRKTTAARWRFAVAVWR